MAEWLKDLLIAVGGGSVVLVGVLTIFKKLFIKLFETGIESSFEKSIEKYRNKIIRSNRAYEIILEREMNFYEKMEPIVAELVPLIHDLYYYIEKSEGDDRKVKCEGFREMFGRYTELMRVLKNETLIFQSYIPQTVFLATTDVVKQMQDDVDFWFDTAKLLFAGEYENIDYIKGKKTVDDLLKKLAFVEVKIRIRLDELSKI